MVTVIGYEDLKQDADSAPNIKLGDVAVLRRDFAQYQRGTRFYVVRLVPCVGGEFLRYNAKAVLTGEPATDAFFHRTVPAEYLRPIDCTKRCFRKGRLTLILDRSKVVPDDPGADTPAMIHCLSGASSTYWCGVDNGLMFPDGSMCELTPKEVDWLMNLEPEVTWFLYPKGSA